MNSCRGIAGALCLAARPVIVAAWAAALPVVLLCAQAPALADAEDTIPDPYLSLDSPSVQEGHSGTTTLNFTARLTDPNGRTKASSKTITAHYEVLSEAGDTATAGQDYTATSGTISFAPGETSGTIGVNVLGDTEVEGDETLTVRWTSWENVWLVSYTHTGTIANDDSAPPISATLSVADAEADEGDALSFSVVLDNAVPDGFTVTPVFTDGTATGGTDYTANTSALSFTGTAGETQIFTVATSEDEDVEDDETLTVGLTVSGTEHDVTVGGAATGTITNDDTAPVVPATVTISDASATEGDALTFTVSLDNAVDGGLTVTPSFTDGTATQGEDYSTETMPLDFVGTAGETVLFTVPTTADDDVEGDETFTVGLTVSGTSHPVTATDTATGTIANDDKAAPANLSIADASATEGDALTFTLTLDNAVPGGLTVTPSFTDGTATKGTDYTANTKALNFAGTASETQTFTVATVEDKTPETVENFTVAFTVSGTAHDVTVATSATGTIRDDDTGPAMATASAVSSTSTTTTILSPAHPDFGRQDYKCDIPNRVVETTDRAIRSKVFQISCGARPGAILHGAVVEIFAHDKYTSSATEGSSGDWDYNFYHSKIKIYPGDRGIQRLGILINDDQRQEGSETIWFKLKWTTKLGYPPAWIDLMQSITDVRIHIDDDDEFNLSVSPGQVWEEDSAKTITVTAATDSGAKLDAARKINVQVGAATDTATEGTDYQTVSNFDLTIPKGSSKGTGTFTLTPIDDSLMEVGERITVAGSASSQINGRTLTARVNGTDILMTDNETINLSASPSSVSEGAGATQVTVTASVEGGGKVSAATPVTVKVGLSGNSGDTADEGHRLCHGFQLHRHDTGRTVERNGHVHADADRRHDDRGHRGDYAGRRQVAGAEVPGGHDHRAAARQRRGHGHSHRDPGQLQRGGSALLGDGEGDGGDVAPDGEDGDRQRGQERRQRDRGHRLRHRGGLHHHHPEERDDRRRRHHADAHRRHDGGERRDHLRVGQRDQHDGERGEHHADRQRRGDRAVGHPAERGRGRRREDDNRDGHGRRAGRLGEDRDGPGGEDRRQRDRGHRLRHRGGLHRHHQCECDERHGHVQADADRRRHGRGRRVDYRVGHQHRRDGHGNRREPDRRRRTDRPVGEPVQRDRRGPDGDAGDRDRNPQCDAHICKDDNRQGGQERRQRDRGHRLFHGVRLHDHHPGERVQRHGHVRTAGEGRRRVRGHRDDLGIRRPRQRRDGDRDDGVDRREPRN